MLSVAVSLPLAMYLRVGDSIVNYIEILFIGTPIFIAISMVFFLLFKIPLRVWQYTSTEDMVAIINAVSISILIFVFVMFSYSRLEGLPRSVMVIDWFLVLSLLFGPRFLYRVLSEKTINIDLSNSSSIQKINIVLIGITEHSEQFIRSVVNNKKSAYRVVAIIDDDADKYGKYIRNIRVYGGIDKLEFTIGRLRKNGSAPGKIVITPGIYSGEKTQEILGVAEKKGLTLSRLPRLTDFNPATDTIALREIALEDLLGRPQTVLDRDMMRKFIAGRSVLITGAGGSIGAEMARQVASYAPSHLCLLDISEYNLYEIDMKISNTYPELSCHPIIGDVKDEKSLGMIFSRENPQIVFHAAALKHVPLSEINACEAMLTNIGGSRNVADVCVKAGVEEMVMISTDKAVNPTNVMGATKRVAESYVQALGNSNKANNTKFVTIRFGNVLGSTGSVIPLFKKQVKNGGPVTVTHPEVTRYFMTIREAVELVIEAGAIIESDIDGGSKIFVLDMGEPVLIDDLARQLIRLSGLTPGEDIQIKYSGLRPGEKLFEELFHGEEAPLATDYEGISLAFTREGTLEEVTKTVTEIVAVASMRNDERAIEMLHKSLPEYK